MTNAAGRPETPRRTHPDTPSGEPLHPAARETLTAVVERGTPTRGDCTGPHGAPAYVVRRLS